MVTPFNVIDISKKMIFFLNAIVNEKSIYHYKNSEWNPLILSNYIDLQKHLIRYLINSKCYKIK